MTPISVEDEIREGENLDGALHGIFLSRSPLNGLNWHDRIPFGPFGESHPPPFTTQCNFPIRASSSSTPYTESRYREAGNDQSTCDDQQGDPFVTRCFWPYRGPESEKLENLFDNHLARLGLDDPDPAQRPYTGEHVKSEDINANPGDGKADVWERANNRSEAEAAGVNSDGFGPVVHDGPWWSGFENPEQAFQTFVQARETLEQFKDVIKNGKSSDAEQDASHSNDAFTRVVGVGLKEKYMMVFPWLRIQDAERMAHESLDWLLLHFETNNALFKEDDALRFFKLEQIVKDESCACGRRSWRLS